MKYAILTTLLIITNRQATAADLKVEALVGYAHHYMPYKGYNDRTFNNNLTSDVALLSLSYKNVSLLGLSDSQGNLSFATTYNYSLINNANIRLIAIAGIYALRSDNEPYMFSPEVKQILPVVKAGSRSFTLMPLVGLQADITLTNSVDLTILATPTFVLVGLKLTIY